MTDLLQLRGSVLDPHGPFELRNALRNLSPGQTMNLIVMFSPLSGGKVLNTCSVCVCVHTVYIHYYHKNMSF